MVLDTRVYFELGHTCLRWMLLANIKPAYEYIDILFHAYTSTMWHYDKDIAHCIDSDYGFLNLY